MEEIKININLKEINILLCVVSYFNKEEKNLFIFIKKYVIFLKL
jgi:hypothetical protein